MDAKLAKLLKIAKGIVAIFASINTSTIIEALTGLKSAQFAGIKAYKNANEEISNHVVIVNFSYANAKAKDFEKLQKATNEDVTAIAESGKFAESLVKQAIEKLSASFSNNSDDATRSAQSQAQIDAYTHITNGIRMHNESGKLFMYALSVSKDVLVDATIPYKVVNSRELTLTQNAVKKHFNLSTAKFRQFEIDPSQMVGVNLNGEKFELV